MPRRVAPEELAEALCRRAGNGRVGLLLDYDGCLADIAPTPEAARLPPATRTVLERLAGHEAVRVAIITGRSRESLVEVIGGAIDGVDLATHGGMRIDGPGGEWIHPGAAAASRTVAGLVDRIRGFAVRHPGVLVEDKRFALAAHYRQAPEARHPLQEEIHLLVGQAAAPLRVIHGKAVFEVQPDIEWDKGRAVEHLLDRWKLGPGALFVGDDVIDEPGFGAVGRRGGVGCLVGEGAGPTEAEVTLADPAACRRMLEALERRLAER